MEVRLVPELYGPAVGGVVCAANRPVVYGYPNFATVLFAYSTGDPKWQRLPVAPANLIPGHFVGIGDVLVNWSNPSGPATPSPSFQTIDLAQPEPRWSANATGPPATAELAPASTPGVSPSRGWRTRSIESFWEERRDDNSARERYYRALDVARALG